MALEDRIESARDANAYPAADEAKFRPYTEFDGKTGHIQTGPVVADQPPDYTAILTKFGYDPERVRIVGDPRVSRWEQRAAVREWSEKHKAYIRTGEYQSHMMCAYRFHLAPVGGPAADLEELVAAARARPTLEGGTHWAVFQAGDLQIAKRSRDGSTEEIVDRYLLAVENAKREIRRLRHRGVEGIQISMPGDCVEGVVSQGAKNLWLTELPITEQVRVLRRLMFHTVEELAPLASRLYLDVVNGNHDQAQRAQNTYPGDGWATEAAIAVGDQLKANPLAFGHVEVRVPEKWTGHMTVPVGDSVVTVVHGHQWRAKGAMRWWSDQALNLQPPGAAHVLQNGHWHVFDVETTADRMRIGSPTFDCGSDWFRERAGSESRRGGVVYLLRGGEVSSLSLV